MSVKYCVGCLKANYSDYWLLLVWPGSYWPVPVDIVWLVVRLTTDYCWYDLVSNDLIPLILSRPSWDCVVSREIDYWLLLVWPSDYWPDPVDIELLVVMPNLSGFCWCSRHSFRIYNTTYFLSLCVSKASTRTSFFTAVWIKYFINFSRDRYFS